MSLRVLAPAGHFNLCTLQQVKDRLEISGSSEDAALGTLVAVASRIIASYKGRELARQRYELTAPGSRRLRLLLPRFPVDRDSVTVSIAGVANTTFTVEEPEIGILYLEGGWSTTRPTPTEDGAHEIVATFRAGYVLPDDLKAWEASATASLGKWIQAPASNPQPLLFEVTTAGALGTTEPTWPTTAGSTVTSGDAVLTARDAIALPLDFIEAAILTVALHRGKAPLARDASVASERLGSQELTYFAPGDAPALALPRAAVALLEAYP